MLEKLGYWVFRQRRSVLVATCIFLLAAVGMLLSGGKLRTGTIAGLEAGEADRLAAEVSGIPEETTLVVLFQAATIADGEGAFDDAIDKALEPLRDMPEVRSIITPEDAGEILGRKMRNAAKKSAYALVTLKGTLDEAIAAYPRVRRKLASNELRIACTGHVPFVHGLDTTLSHDLIIAEAISLPLAIVVLLFVFRSIVAAILPVVVGALAVLGAIAVVLQLSRLMNMAEYTINVCSLIGLGVAIDYCLFTVSRYREELAQGRSYEAALGRAVARSGRIVAFSGLAVGTGLAGLLFFKGSYLVALGIGGAVVVLLSVLFALTSLPALLAVLGPHIDSGSLRRPDGSSATRFRTMAGWVMERPIAVLMPTLGILLVMGIPFAHLKMAAADVHVLPETATARADYERFRDSFPDRGTEVVVVVRFPGVPLLTADRVASLFELTQRLHSIPHVTHVDSVVDGAWATSSASAYETLLHPPEETAAELNATMRMTVGEKVVVLRAAIDAAAESDAARNVVRQVRASRHVSDGDLLVGGNVANDLDTTAFMVSHAPRAIAFIVSVTLVVLFLLLRSIVLPIKAVLMNFVSIAGSFGALVWVFQDGHLFVREPRPLEPTLPVLLFAVLFGLSMDYEVLMLSRIKESYERTGDNTAAVIEGLEKTAGLITSAAAIMVAVFGAFALAEVILIRAVGFGMALAVAIDATLVRILLVPATMRLFGELNWWAPRALGGRAPPPSAP